MMSLRKIGWAALSGAVLLSAATAADAGDFTNAVSLQGFTGIMNTPTANVQKEGSLALWSAKQHEQHSNQINNENYLFSVGLFSLLEGGGRVAQGYADLSAQFKLTTAPLIPKSYSWIPSVAVGAQDVGGQAHHFSSTYLVATEEISRVRLSLGYGSGPDRMKGVFGGAELKAFDWLYILGEYDTKDTNVGARIVTPDILGYPVNLQGTIKSTLNRNPGTIDFSFGVQFALGKEWHSQEKSIIPTVIPSDSGRQDQVETPVKAGAEAVAVSPVITLGSTPSRIIDNPVKAGPDVAQGYAVAAANADSLSAFRDRLVVDGFLHVRVGSDSADLLVIEYENARYTRNQLDGMGVVLGMVVKYAPAEFKTVRLVLKVQDIRMLQVTAPIGMLASFFSDAGVKETFGDLVAVSYAIDDDKSFNFLEEKSFSPWFRSRLTLAPRLRTYVATEVSTFDYLLSFVPSLTVDLWKGAIVNATADIPVAWSQGYDDGGSFKRNDPQLASLMLTQALRPRSDFMVSLSGGMVSNDVYGTMNEAYWYSKDGSHRLGFQQGFGKDNNYSFNRTAYLGSYRYFYTPLDTSLTLTGGSFWDNDRGVRADLTRFWGDTSFSVFYKSSRTANNDNYQIGGIQLAFPLTPRQGMKPYPVQVKGTDEWNYRLQTVTHSPTGANSVFIPIGETPPVKTVPQSYYDRDRLTPEYVKAHLLRVRDAAIRYVQPE